MRILGITETCDLGSLYQRLLAEGHEVRVSVSEKLAQGTMAGLVPRTADWQKELAWVAEAGSEGLILFEAVGFGALQAQLRKEGFAVIGGSEFGDRLESDRAFAQQLLADLGLKVAAICEHRSVESALADLKARPRRCVFKKNAASADTFVGRLDDGRDVAAFLAALSPGEGESFLLLDHVEGVEVGVGAYFDGEHFLRPACIDWEHKYFFAGDMGELTGEMGTVASYQGSDRLFDASLALLEPKLREAGHVGYVNLNTIVNADGVWPLELTCRFGYPGYAVLEPLQALSWSQLFAKMIAKEGGRFPTLPGFSLAVVLSTPPFPWSRLELDMPVGLPVLLDGVDPRQVHLGEVGLDEGQLVTSGLYGWTAVVTGLGASAAEAKREAYAAAERIYAPNIRYRLDIGDKLIGGDYQRLVEWGWLPPLAG